MSASSRRSSVPPIERGDVLAAVHYCARGGPRPSTDAAFESAKRNGLLAQDDVWRATERGMGALIAAGLVAGEPAPRETHLHVVWAVSDVFTSPHFVAAWSDGMHEAYPEVIARERAEAEQRFRELGDIDGSWRFWTEVQTITQPTEVRCARCVCCGAPADQFFCSGEPACEGCWDHGADGED